MQSIVQRFIGRYEVWRDQRPHSNPLHLFAVIVGISLLRVAYLAFVTRDFTWRVVPATALDIAFLVLFFRVPDGRGLPCRFGAPYFSSRVRSKWPGRVIIHYESHCLSAASD
jgi:hypothetical protein